MANRSRSFTDDEDPLLFGKSALGSVLQPDFDGGIEEPLDISPGITFEADPWRWIVLFCFCFAAWVNSILWITFAPIAIATEEFYGISAFEVNILSLLFFVIYIPGAFIASWILDNWGLRSGVLVGTALLFFGSFIRMLGAFPNGYYVVCVGQAMCAFGQPFIQNSPAKVAAHWFPDNQRALATTLGSVANPIGGALGLLIPPVIMGIFNSLPILLIIDTGLALISFVLVITLFRAKPKNPPSLTALRQQKKEENQHSGAKGKEFREAIVFLFTDRSYVLLFLCYALNVGAFQALATLVSQLTSPFGYSPGESGLMGATVVITGVFSAGILGKLMDRTRAYTIVLFICYALAWYWNLLWSSVLAPNNYIWLVITAGLYGTALLPVLPIGVALAAEVTYPISEATPIGFMVMGGMIWSAVLIFAMSALIAVGKLHWACYLVGIQSGTSYLLMWFFKGDLKRSRADSGF